MKKWNLAELAEKLGAQLVGNQDHIITGVADLDSATPSDLSFLASPRYEKSMHRSQAGVVIVSPQTELPSNRNFLIHPAPTQAFQEVLKLIFKNHRQTGFTGIHPTAVVHPTATIKEGVTLGPFAVVDEGAILEKEVSVGAHCYIGPFSHIGQKSTIYPHVVIREYSIIGEEVSLQPGAVIGSCGFGYYTDPQGVHHKLEQFGNVELENRVEIGANTTIDRARFKVTRVKEGSKIDNLVQIAHGVEVGKHNFIVAQVGLAGSSKTGNHVIFAGQAAMVGHIHVASHVVIASRGGVTKSIDKPGQYAGVPAIPVHEHNRKEVLLRNIDKIVSRLSRLEKLIENQLPLDSSLD